MNAIGFLGGGILVARVIHRQEPQPAAAQRSRRHDRLVLKAGPWLQAAFVKHFGCEIAYQRVKPPRLFEEQAAIRFDRLVPPNK